MARKKVKDLGKPIKRKKDEQNFETLSVINADNLSQLSFEKQHECLSERPIQNQSFGISFDDSSFFEETTSVRLTCSKDELNHFLQNSKKGFDTIQRRQCWLLVTGALQAQLSAPFHYYGDLVQLCEDLREVKFPNGAFHQIELDLNRTYSDETFFNSKTEQGKLTLAAIQRVCEAYAIRNSHVGYCQGFNCIVGRLLQVVSEEEAFWIFVQLIENTKYFTCDYFQQVIGAQIDRLVMIELVKQKLPQLMAHFESVDFDLGNVVLQYFSCLFSYNFNVEILITLWDAYMIKGHKILYRITLAIFYLLSNRLLKVNDPIQLKETMESIQAFLQEPQMILQLANIDKFKIKSCEIEQLRNQSRAQVIANMEQHRERLPVDKMALNHLRSRFPLWKSLHYVHQKCSQDDLIQRISCDEQWPVCFFDYASSHAVHDHLVLKSGQLFTIIEDYFFKQLRQNKMQSVASSTSLPGLYEDSKERYSNEDFLPMIELEDIQLASEFGINQRKIKLNTELVIQRCSHFCNNQRVTNFKKAVIDKDDILVLMQKECTNFKLDCCEPPQTNLISSQQFLKYEIEVFPQVKYESIEMSIEKFCCLLD